MNNILLGFTGSVASSLAPKLVRELSILGHVNVVSTSASLYFFEQEDLCPNFYEDRDEWPGSKYKKDDEVLHISLRQWADVFVIAPLSANSLAKMANGLCDNLLTSIFRAWDRTKPIVLAPSMNTVMWESPFTKQHLDVLKKIYDCEVVLPQSKLLACGEMGEGAMAQIDDILNGINKILKWNFPIENCVGIPIGDHPGAFGFIRKHGGPHTGVDLYSKYMMPVFAVESGRVVSIEPFTGEKDNSPWWENTDCVLIEGTSGVCCYGEIKPVCLEVGEFVKKGSLVGHVTPVLKEGNERPDIPGHSRCMLHFELYKHGVKKASTSWKQGIEELGMSDPTPLLKDALNAPGELIMKEKEN